MKGSPRPPSAPENDKDLVQGNISYPLVGIGAAAGGLAAIVRFFEHMPATNGMAFIIVLPLSPQRDSTASQMIQRVTNMPVIEITAKTRIKKEHVYIVALNSQLLMEEGLLYIGKMERTVGKHATIDIFFRALAHLHQQRSIAILLSGTGADGTVGIASIKEQGGVTMAQAPDDAEFDSMPRAAINTGMVDFILPSVDMPQKLIDLWNNARNIELPPLEERASRKATTADPVSSEIAEEYLQQIIKDLGAHTGHDFRHYKRATVLRRIERRMQVRALATLPAYHHLLEAEPAEYFNLLQDMLIGVTNFFRDREVFETLERDIIPKFFHDKDADEPIRVWVPACATGEEAYSIAMLLMDQASNQSITRPIQIFASDIDEQAINFARKGSYPSSIVTDVSPPRLRQFFSRHDNHYIIQKNVRDQILFASHNLLRDPPFSKIDLISCRNLLIYLNRNVQAQVLEILHFALKPNGILLLGSSESADSINDLFVAVDRKHHIYRAKPLPRAINTIARPGKYLPRVPDSRKIERLQLSYNQIHQQALMHYGSVSVLIDNELNILHMSDRASHFLRFNAGEPSRNLLALVAPELRLELRTALHQAQQNIITSEKRTVSLTRGDQHFDVTIGAHRFRDENTPNELMLIIFSEEPKPTPDIPQTRPGNDAVLQHLEAELQRNQQQLQETIEHAKAATEELRTTNEELQAMNEELRSATEEHARLGEEPMRLVAASTRDYAIITMDVDGLVTSWNKAAERVFGYLEAEIMGQSCDLIFTHEDRARGVPDEERQRALKDGSVEDERWHMRKDGLRFYCSGVMTPLTGNDKGELYGYAKIARDQTQRVELESQREAALSEEQLGRWNAETSNALKDQFLAIMSHELRHPLNLIHINIELLSRLQVLQESPLGRKATAIIRSSVQSQAKIIEDLLDMSRLNTGKLTLVKVPVDLAMLVNSITEVLQADTERNGITIVRSGTDEPMLVMADSVRIEQVILNLLSNAFKFTPAGGTVTINLALDNGEARLEVIDTGQGISAEALPGIFDMFSQPGPTSSPNKSGLGIGLALVRQIAELHEGRVKARSDGPGKGSCFSLWLPLASGSHQKIETVPAMLEKIAGVCILLVDDSEDMVTAFKTLLEMEGARVLVATNAKAGLALLMEEKVDLLISDISMPEMNGYEFIEQVRQLPEGKTLPAIALSGLSREQDIAQCYKAGFSAHFNKPIALEKLNRTIITLLRPAEMDNSG
jgi:two-component system CheB/CheR fusion protein